MTRYKPIPPSMFVQHRRRFIKKMKPNSVALFFSAEEMHRNGDQYYPYRQQSDFFYLTGIEQEQSILLLYPDAVFESHRIILFIRKSDTHLATWEGEKLSKNCARDISGIKTIFYLDGFESVLHACMLRARYCYLSNNENFRLPENTFAQSRHLKYIQGKYPFHRFERSAPILSDLRVVKDVEEIAIIQKAIDITADAFDVVLKTTKPGIKEYEVEASIIHSFIKNGSSGHAYSPIVASGSNACTLHYTNNDQICQDGALVLLDFGAEYSNYAADLSRTIPVNGHFSARQKEVYQACLDVFKNCASIMRAGITLAEYNIETAKIMEGALIDLGLIDKYAVKNQNPKQPLYKKYFMHGTAHFLGLDVHDVGDNYGLLKAGMILTCEPGIYIREESIGIRIENNLLVTEDSPIDLMKDVPIEIDAIESIMNC